MNTQNILQNYGLKLDLELDSSEYYDYDLGDNRLVEEDQEYKDFTYEEDFSSGFCHFNTIQLNEFDNTVNDTGYTYSGLTLVYEFTGFTPYFDVAPVTGETSGHTYADIYLNNDVFTYTGLPGETHYFEIYDYYSGGTPSIDPLLTGMTGVTLETILTGFTTSIIECTEQLSPLTGVCCPTEAIKSNLPWVYLTDHGDDNCDDFIGRRPERGNMVDFVFNRNGLPWSEGNVFFYTGVRDEYDPENYADNNLSFSFTNDGRIIWKAIRYSGYCSTDIVSDDPLTGVTYSGYTPTYYLDSGQTESLCVNGVSDDFNITIAFERYYPYSGCSLANEGGWNDMVIDNSTIVDNEYLPDLIEELNNHWRRERWKRLGTLKIYLNGRPIYKIDDWEEIVLSERGFQPFAQAVGGGVTGSGGIHEGVCCFDIKYVGYLEDVMNFPDIRERYLTITKENFDITECNDACVDDIGTFTPSPSNFAATATSPTDISLSWEL